MAPYKEEVGVGGGGLLPYMGYVMVIQCLELFINIRVIIGTH